MTVNGSHVEGADRLARTMHDAAADVQNMAAADSAAGNAVLAQTQARVPRVSGSLARSLHVDRSGPGAVVASSLVYAPVIHNGWPAHNIRANPFLSSAADASEALVKAAYLSEVRKDIERVKGA